MVTDKISAVFCRVACELRCTSMCAALHISAQFDTVCGINYSLLLLDIGNRIIVVGTVTGLWAERSGIRFPKEGKLFSKASRPTVGPTRPSA